MMLKKRLHEVYVKNMSAQKGTHIEDGNRHTSGLKQTRMEDDLDKDIRYAEKNRPVIAELRRMASSACGDRTPVDDMSSHNGQHVHRDDGQRGADGREIEMARTEYTAYATPQQSAGLTDPNKVG